MKQAVLMAILAIFSTSPVVAGTVENTLYDDFSTPPRWKPFAYSQGAGIPRFLTKKGTLQITLPANASGANFAAGYSSLCKFRGEFDVQTDFQLIDFPEKNGVRVGIVAGDAISSARWGSGAEVIRISWGSGDNATPGTESYITHIDHDCCHASTTTDTSGKLRLTRLNGQVSGYFWDHVTGQWKLLNQKRLPTADVHIEIGAWSHTPQFSGQLVRISFDNFIVNQGTLVGASCPVH